MKFTLLIDGGLGRILTSIPALEQFVLDNPDSIIVTYFWTPIIWGNPKISNQVIDNNTKGLFELIKHSKIIKPEPYFNTNYINSKTHLSQAWNEVVNFKETDIQVPKIFLSKFELNAPNIKNNRPVIGLQPFGSTASFSPNEVTDSSGRSLNKEFTEQLIKRLKQENFDILLLTDKSIPFLDSSDFINYWPENCRWMSAAIANVDYFIGIDSAGQHIARCFNKPGTVIMGGTSAVNVTYPDHFQILNNLPCTYHPYRIAEFDAYLAELINSNIMEFDTATSQSYIDSIIQDIKDHI